jgi:hypothetical protein
MKPAGFNPKARWDRNLPAGRQGIPQTNPVDCGLLNERIEVLAYFKAGKIYPRLFIWNNKEYAIKQITYNWQERLGRETISYFSISTGSDFYQISFNNTNYSWKIDKIIE